jgi:Protein chain release factor B
MLKTRLYNFELKKKKKVATDQKNLKSKISLRHQIKSNKLHPYKLIKNNKTNYETTNPNKILNSQINNFLKNFLYKKNN